MEFNTFSITARCARTGRFGIAISTAVPAVGNRCIHAHSGVGAIASQAVSNPYLGIQGLELLAQGLSAAVTADRVLSEDAGSEYRQLAVVDRQGRAAAHTGAHTKEWRGHLTGENYAVAGNLLVGSATLEAMAHAFEASKDVELAERLMQALEAGQAVGGDRRGRVSAALYVVHTEDYAETDLRVDDHPDPVVELRRLLTLYEERLPYNLMTATKENSAGIYDPQEREAFLARWHASRKLP